MSSKSPLFTVVAVCCNVADYVEEMILSIKNQTFADFECLAVVEDSSDKTEEIVRSAVAGDKRFSVITLPRSGSASVPRNYGIKHGKGKYLVFVDGDDWIELNALEKFAAIINKTPDLDIIVSGSHNFKLSPNGKWECVGTHVIGKPGDSYPTGAEFLDASGFEHCLNTGTWMHVYRRKLLLDNNLFQAPGRLHQDDEWWYRVFIKADKVEIAPFLYYNYRYQPKSVTHKPSPKTIYDRAENFKAACNFFNAGEYPPFLKKKLAMYFCRNFLHSPFLRRRYASKVNSLLPREDCRKALLSCLGTPEQFRSYCNVVRSARKTSLLFIPLMYLARTKWGFVPAEYILRFRDRVVTPSAKWILKKLKRK